MHGFLKQSTASQQRLVGPFVDDNDFKTPETGLTIANTDVKLSKNAAAGVNKNSGGGTHRNNGMYALTFNATDTNTVGELKGSINVGGALIVTFSFTVLEESVYDAFFASGAAGFLRPSVAGRTLDVSAAGEVDLQSDQGGVTIGTATNVVSILTAVTLSAGSVDAIWDEPQSGHTTAGTFGKFLDVEVSSVSGGSGLTQQDIRDAMKLAPSGGTPAVGSIDEHLDDILEDTDELQTDWANGGRLDNILDARMPTSHIAATGGVVDEVTLVGTTTVNSDMRGTDGAALATVCTEARLAELDAANLPADIAAVKSQTNDINADTQNIQSRLPAALVNGRMDSSIDDTGMEPGAIDAVLQRQMTEGYAADGVAPTLEQALFMIQQMLTEFGISGVTLTMRKLDGATPAATFTLDDASNPTSLTRAS